MSTQNVHMIPTLGLDVLLILFGHLTRQCDVAALSQASKALHSTGVRQLLRLGVTIATDSQLASFAAFISGDVPGRAPYVWKLYIKLDVDPIGDDESAFGDEEMGDEDEDSSESLRMLGDILRQTTALEDLSIDSCEELLEREPAVLEAIIALKKLRRLQVSSVGELTSSILEKIKSSLVEVDLHCYSEEMDEPDDPVSIIEPHRTTLERLSASYVEVQDTDTDFPRLRALALRKFSSFDPLVLRKLFPNLVYLELSPGVDDIEDPEELRAAIREEHVEEPWNALDHLCGSVHALYGLGGAQKVERVDVDDLTMQGGPLTRLHTLIADTTPSRLLVHIGYGPSAPFDGAALAGLLPVLEVSSITHLVLDLCLSTLQASLASLMASLTCLLSSHPVSFFILRLNNYFESAEHASSAPTEHSNYNTGVYEAFQPPCHDALVEQLATACPQLKHVSFDVMGHIPTYWLITRTEGCSAVCGLEPMVGLELVHCEGLWFNDRSMGLSAYV